MTDWATGKANEVLNAIAGDDIRRYVELGYAGGIVDAIASALREADKEARQAEKAHNIEILEGLKPVGCDPILDGIKGALEHAKRAIHLSISASVIKGSDQ